jgi:hypothetical protein
MDWRVYMLYTFVQQDSHRFDQHAPLIEEGPYMDDQNKDE